VGLSVGRFSPFVLLYSKHSATLLLNSCTPLAPQASLLGVVLAGVSASPVVFFAAAAAVCVFSLVLAV
jgi:hypothetical protein